MAVVNLSVCFCPIGQHWIKAAFKVFLFESIALQMPIITEDVLILDILVYLQLLVNQKLTGDCNKEMQ